MTKDQKAAFLDKWWKRSQHTWNELRKHHRHGLGSEKLPLKQIRPQAPQFLEDEDHVLVFRHEGNLPFAGIRAQDTFYVVWIETRYGDLYDHGS